MINVFTLTNINTKITEGKLSKMFIPLVCIKLVALRINRCTRSSSQFQKRLVTPALKKSARQVLLAKPTGKRPLESTKGQVAWLDRWNGLVRLGVEPAELQWLLKTVRYFES